MLLFHILYSLFLIAIGFLVKAKPNLIAGYNTMSEEKKRNVDIEGLSSFMRQCFIVMGLVTMLFYLPFHWSEHEQYAIIPLLLVVPIGVGYMTVKAQRFDGNRKKQ